MSSAEETVRGRSAAQRALYELCCEAILIAFCILYRYRAWNASRVPSTGPCLIVANHQSHFDPPAIGICVRHRQLSFVARKTLFASRFFGWLIGALGSVPIDQSGASDLAAIRTILTHLDRGEIFMIFPEGSRTPDGELQEFKRGFLLLLKRSRCPVIPAAIEGAFQTWPRSKSFPRFWKQRLMVEYGNLISHDDLLKDGADAAMERVRNEIASLQASLKRRRAASGSRPMCATAERAVSGDPDCKRITV